MPTALNNFEHQYHRYVVNITPPPKYPVSPNTGHIQYRLPLGSLVDMMSNPNRMDEIEAYFSQYDGFEDIVHREYDNLGRSSGIQILLTAFNNNPNALSFLRNNRGYIKWRIICRNSNAIDLLEDCYDRHFCLQGKPLVIPMGLSRNANATHILREHKEQINWNQLCYNDNGIELFKENLDKLNLLNAKDWNILCSNPNAIDLIIDNYDKTPCFIDKGLWMNPNLMDMLIKHYLKIKKLKTESKTMNSIFEKMKNTLEYDYRTIESDRKQLNCELGFHPKFIRAWIEEDNDLEDFDFD